MDTSPASATIEQKTRISLIEGPAKDYSSDTIGVPPPFTGRPLVFPRVMTTESGLVESERAEVSENPIAVNSGDISTAGAVSYETRSIQPSVSPRARPYLAGATGSLVLGLLASVANATNRSRVKVEKVNIDLRYPRRERRRNPKIWLIIKTGPSVHPNQALALWDAIGLEVEQWRLYLDALSKRILDEDIFISVDWVEPNASPVG